MLLVSRANHYGRQQRTLMGALITIDVHARDVVRSMVKNEVSSVTDFEWTKQLRYYWEVREAVSATYLLGRISLRSYQETSFWRSGAYSPGPYRPRSYLAMCGGGPSTMDVHAVVRNDCLEHKEVAPKPKQVEPSL